MRKSSRGRRFARHCALAFAVTVGAGSAFLYTAFNQDQVQAADRHAQVAAYQPSEQISNQQGGSPQATPATSTSPQPILPFNAKLTSHDIPVAGGGTRSGGCSGALIDPNWIITAGHCFHDLKENRVGGRPLYHMTVVVGKLKDSDPGGETRRVVDVRQSPLNDLAIAKLDSPITDIAPLTLDEQPATIGQELEFAGWGSTSATVVRPSDHLKRGRFAVAQLNETTLYAQPLMPRTVENSPCKDDSGSPYFVSTDNVHGLLVAIEDSGPDCPQPGNEVLARIDVVASWIHEQIGK